MSQIPLYNFFFNLVKIEELLKHQWRFTSNCADQCITNVLLLREGISIFYLEPIGIRSTIDYYLSKHILREYHLLSHLIWIYSIIKLLEAHSNMALYKMVEPFILYQILY